MGSTYSQAVFILVTKQEKAFGNTRVLSEINPRLLKETRRKENSRTFVLMT